MSDMEESARRPIFAEPLHTLGEHLQLPSHSMRLALAWQVGAELVRRHPDNLRLIETFPHQYGPALTVWQMEAGSSGLPVLLMTLGEWTHITPLGTNWDAGRFNWLDVLLADNRRAYVVAQLESVLGLSAPVATPATTEASIGPRVLAAFLARTALTPHRWAVAGGVFVDDDGQGTHEELFQAMPLVANDTTKHRPAEHPLALAESRYWFIGPVKDGSLSVPVVAMDMFAGRAWRGESEVDLLALYRRRGDKLDPVVNDVFPPAL